MVHVIPVVVLQLFGGEGDPGDLVSVVVRGVEAIAVVDVEWGVRMPRNQNHYFVLMITMPGKIHYILCI